MSPASARTGFESTGTAESASGAGSGATGPGSEATERGGAGLAVVMATTSLLAQSLITTAIGVMVGVTSGFLGGRTDAFLMRLTDIMIALPVIPVLIVLGAIVPALPPRTPWPARKVPTPCKVRPATTR